MRPDKPIRFIMMSAHNTKAWRNASRPSAGTPQASATCRCSGASLGERPR
jgi:hypothetical protein